MKTNTVTIIVLDDGETWGGINGASVLTITEGEHKLLCEGLMDPKHLNPVSEFMLSER